MLSRGGTFLCWLRNGAILAVNVALLALLVVSSAGAHAPARVTASDETVPRVAPGTAPAPGSGSIDVPFLRAVSGESLEAEITGRRVSIRLIGVQAPSVITPCGQQAAEVLQGLVMGGGRLVEERGFGFDPRTLRYYHVLVKQRSVAMLLVRGGFVKPNGKGKAAARLAKAAKKARAARVGCVWGKKSAGTSRQPQASKRTTGPTLAATTFPSGFTQDVVASGLVNPTAVAFIPDGRILVAQKRGQIRIIKNGSLLTTPAINLSSRVNDYWDRGLIGLAVDPNFASNGYIYALYSYEHNAGDYTGKKTARLSRFTMSGDTATLGTELVVLGSLTGAGCASHPVGSDCLPAEWYGHGVGAIRFAADGTIFLTNGDAASWNTVVDDALRAQNVDSLAGKVIHVSATGQGLSGNPFWNGNANAARSKVWAYGLRNAYRFGLKPGSSIPFLGDVGWNATEELDVVPAGANLGWPCYEGTARQSGYESKAVCQTLYAQGASAVRNPLVQYQHSGSGAAVTGGAFYTGTTYPSQYQGKYFYADYARGWIRYLGVDGSNNLTSGPTDFATAADGPVDLVVGPDTNLYYVAINSGELRRIRYGTPPPPPPPPPSGSSWVSDMVWASETNGWGPAERNLSNGENAAGDGRTITLNGVTYAKGIGGHAASEIRVNLAGGCSRFTASVGVDDEVATTRGSIVFEVWAGATKVFDSGLMTGATATKPVDVSVAGAAELRLVITNGGNGNGYDHGDWASASLQCGSGGGNQLPTVTIATPTVGTTFKVGDVINFAGSANDPEDGPLTGARLSWEIKLQHCSGGCHTHHGFSSATGAGGSFTVPNHGDDFSFDIILTATDSAGGTATKTVTINPQTVTVTLATSPSGLQVIWGGDAGVSPLVKTAVVGSTHTISVPSPQGSATFQSWSDGGAIQHDVVTGTTNQTFTATFTGGGGGGTPTSRWLSDMTWASASNGYGPVEKDRSNGENAAGDGRTITLNGVTHAKGLGTHAASDVLYDLGGACTSFTADVGVDDEVGSTRGSVVFQVWANGTKVWESAVLTNASATVTANVPMTGVNQLRLVVTDGGNGVNYDHGDWASARVTCTGP